MKKMFKLVVGLCSFMLITACGSASNEGVKNQVQEQPSEMEDSNKVAEKATKCDYFLFSETPAIRAEIKGNDVMLEFDEKELGQIRLGGSEGNCLSEKVAKVENLKGTPQSVFIGDIGNDFNPILCVLLENGDVQIMSLFDCVRHCDFEASDVLLHGISNFKEGPGGCYEDDGETRCDYVTIYAISGDKETEITLGFAPGGCLQYAEPMDNGSVGICQLNLTSDWKMSYVLGWEESEIDMMLRGNYWAIHEDFEKMVFRYGYELKKQIEYDYDTDDGEEIVTAISQKGVFELRYSESQGYLVTPIEGVDFAGKGMNVPVEFKTVW